MAEKLTVLGARGPGLTEIARKTGNFGVAPTDSDTQALEKFADAAIQQNPGFKGDPGPTGASDNTYSTLATFKASDIARKTASLVGVPGVSDGRFNWTLGNYTGQADDVNIIKADSTALTVGAWVRQEAGGISVPPEAPVMKRRALIGVTREKDLTPQDFSGTSTGITDWGQYFQDMIDYAEANYRPIKLPAGRYPIGRTLNINSEIIMRGAGAGTQRATDLVNTMTDTSAVLLNIDIPSGKSALSLDIGNFGISTPGSFSTGYARAGCAIRMNTALGHIAANSKLTDLIINNHRLGVDLGGVIYKCLFDNIRVGGESVQTGLPLGPDIAGIRYGIISYQDVTYNITSNCEVTNVRNGGYAFRGSSQNSTWINCTADGPFDLTSIGGSAINCTVEGWTQDAGASPVNYALGFSRFGMVQGSWLRAIPAGKVGIGLYAAACDVVAGLQNDGPPPPTPVYLDNIGVLLGVKLTDVVNKIPASGAGGLNDCVAIGCGTVTDFGLAGLSAAIAASSQRIGFYGKTPVMQGPYIAPATDAATAISATNAMLAYLVSRGDFKAQP